MKTRFSLTNWFSIKGSQEQSKVEYAFPEKSVMKTSEFIKQQNRKIIKGLFLLTNKQNQK